MNKEIRIGTVLVATNKCRMLSDKSEEALIVGKEYIVYDITMSDLVVKSEYDDNHFYGLGPDDMWYWGNYFRLK